MKLKSRLASYMNREGVAALDDQAKYTVAQMAQMEAMLEDSKIEQSMRESSLLALGTRADGNAASVDSTSSIRCRART